MITVYVWPPKGENVGHASARVGPTYVSWWPASAIEVALPSVSPTKSPSKEVGFQPGRLRLESSPIRGRTYAQDERDEGGPPPGSHVTTINGLNERAILDWWGSFGLQRGTDSLQGPLPRYHLLYQSCSTVVARALRVGGGDTYSGWWNSNNAVWTPLDVHRYAQEIAANIGKPR